MGNHAYELGAEDPLTCGLPSDPEDDDANVGLSSVSRVLLALINFLFLLLVLIASCSPPTAACLRGFGALPRAAGTFCCLQGCG